MEFQNVMEAMIFATSVFFAIKGVSAKNQFKASSAVTAATLYMVVLAIAIVCDVVWG